MVGWAETPEPARPGWIRRNAQSSGFRGPDQDEARGTSDPCQLALWPGSRYEPGNRTRGARQPQPGRMEGLWLVLGTSPVSHGTSWFPPLPVRNPQTGTARRGPRGGPRHRCWPPRDLASGRVGQASAAPLPRSRPGNVPLSFHGESQGAPAFLGRPGRSPGSAPASRAGSQRRLEPGATSGPEPWARSRSCVAGHGGTSSRPVQRDSHGRLQHACRWSAGSLGSA